MIFFKGIFIVFDFQGMHVVSVQQLDFWSDKRDAKTATPMKTPHICCVFWEIRHVWRWYLSKNPCRQCNSMFWLIGDASQKKICVDNVQMHEDVICAIACVRTNTTTYDNIKQKHGKKKRTHDDPLLLPVFQFCLSPYMTYLPKRTKTTTAPPTQKSPAGFKRIVTCPNGLKKYHWSNKNGSVIPLSISQQKEVYLCQCFCFVGKVNKKPRSFFR